MEAGTDLVGLGRPLGNVVRVRPVLPDELRSGDLRVTDNQRKIVVIEPGKLQGTAEDEFTFDFAYVDNTFDDIYERSLAPLINRDEHGTPGFMDGVNCATLVFGNSTSGKTYTVEGSGPAAKDGVIPTVISGIFEAISEKMSDAATNKRRNMKWRHKLSLQYVEVVDEKIFDLLNPQKIELDVDEQGISDGLGIRNLTRKVVDTEDELYHHFRVGQSSRTAFRTEFGLMSERAASVFSLELHQVSTHLPPGGGKAVEEHLFSRYLVIDLPGAEKLADDPTTLRIREGPTLNNAVIAFGQLVKALAQARDLREAEYIDFRQSKLTAMLPDVLGGNCRTTVITTIPPADYKANSFVLEFSSLFKKIRNFPVVNDGRQVALLRKYNNNMHLLKQQLLAAGFGGLEVDDRLTNHLIEIHKLEKKIIEDEKVQLALREEREQLRDKIAQLNARVNQLLAEKSGLQQERIASEEEKLKVSKVLVDLQIENTSLLEQAVDKEFQLENKMLQQENDIMELEMSGQAKQKRIEQLEKQHRDDLTLIEDLKSELAAVRSNYSSVLNDLDAEKARSEELSVELLNLVNAKNALVREREQLVAQRENLMRMNAELEKRLHQAESELKEASERVKEVQLEMEHLRTELARAKLELDAARIQFQEQKLMGDRKYTVFEQGKGEEVLALRRELAERQEEHKHALARQEEEMANLNARYKKASRRAAELETELNDKAETEAAFGAENSELKLKITQLSESYREKLHKYIADVSQLSTEVARGGAEDSILLSELRAAVDAMFQELVNTYGARESQFLEELRRSREHNMHVIKKNRRLYQAYRSLRYQLEDLAPAGVNISVLEEASLQVEGDEGDVEKQQRQVMEELRERLSTAEAAAVAKSEKALRDAEKYTAQAAQMQAKFSQQQNAIQDLKAKLAQAEEDRREKHGELQRLEQQLLEELSELKAKGVHNIAPAAPQADPEMLNDLRRQLDRERTENQRMQADMQRLQAQVRAAPPPAAPAGPCPNCASKEQELASLRSQLQAKEGELAQAKAAAAAAQQQAAAAKAAAPAPAAPAPAPAAGGGGAELAAARQRIVELEAEVEKLKAELANDDLKAMISGFASGTQADLESEVAELRTQNTMLEQELEDVKAALAKKS